MNIIRRFAAYIHAKVLELFLCFATILLIVQLSWPAVRHWSRLPGPGQTGFDSYTAEALASEFVIKLPTSYRTEQKWPLIVFLHGSGYSGGNPSILVGHGPFHEKLPAIVAAPQCLQGRSWKTDEVADFIRYLALRYPVDAKRVYLIGSSMGGYGTWATAAAYPNLFAAIVPISGGGDPSSARALASYNRLLCSG